MKRLKPWGCGNRGRYGDAMRTDPIDNGGLFIGRRPGTRPIKYRSLPEYRSPLRQRADRLLAALIVGVMVFVCLLFWGPLPIAWMWVGSHVQDWSGSPTLGIVSSFLGLLANLLVALMVMRRLDLFWILVRRAGGLDQRAGMIERVFGLCASVGTVLFFGWLFVFAGPDPLAPLR
jgi:hypothetical protein